MRIHAISEQQIRLLLWRAVSGEALCRTPTHIGAEHATAFLSSELTHDQHRRVVGHLEAIESREQLFE